jgi:hypothetical protein
MHLGNADQCRDTGGTTVTVQFSSAAAGVKAAA